MPVAIQSNKVAFSLIQDVRKNNRRNAKVIRKISGFIHSLNQGILVPTLKRVIALNCLEQIVQSIRISAYMQQGFLCSFPNPIFRPKVAITCHDLKQFTYIVPIATQVFETSASEIRSYQELVDGVINAIRYERDIDLPAQWLCLPKL